MAPVDYDKLAQQSGGAAASSPVDYDALARQHGGATVDVPSQATQPQPSLWDRIKGIPQAYEEQMAPVDAALAPRPSDGTLGTAAHNVLGSAASTVLAPIMHPVDSALGALKSATPLGTIYDQAQQAKHLLTGDVHKNAADMVPKDVPQALETAGGQILGMGATAALGGVAGAGADAADALGLKLAPNTRVSAMEGFRIPSGSPKAEPLLGRVEIAKPYLQGVEDLKGLQERLPAAKSEVYKPYDDFITANRFKSIDGPSGPSTVGDLYDRDKEITAQLGNIKNDPAAAQQAAQKGLTQADLMAEQKGIRSVLFPAAEDAGVDATGINKTYGALKSVEKQVAGKNTDLVPSQPMGLGRVRNFSLKNPLKAIDEVGSGLKDINQGRWWSGNPVDLGIQDTFANAGPKPDFGKYEPLPRLQLPAQASPITLGEPHELTAPYRIPTVEPSETARPRKFGSKGVLGSVFDEGRK